MKKRELLFASVMLVCLLSAGISFFKIYASAERRMDQVLVDKITLPAATKKHVMKEVLLEAAHLNEMPQVTKVEIPQLVSMQEAKTGQYQIPLKVYVRFNKVLTRTVTVNLVDQTAPVIHQVKPLQFSYGAKFKWEDYLDIKDDVDGTISLAESQIDKVDTKKVGKQKVTVQVKDRANNIAKKELEVEIFPKIQHNATTSAKNTEYDSVNRALAPKTIKAQSQGQTQKEMSPTSNEESTNSNKLKNVLQFNGQTIPFRHMPGASAAPETGAATWKGTGLVKDGEPTHFIGHNPGDFHSVMELYVGAPITVYDDYGDKKTYHVYEVIDVTDEGYNANDLKDDVLPRLLDEKGERISLQTCIDEQINRCVLAR